MHVFSFLNKVYYLYVVLFFKNKYLYVVSKKWTQNLINVGNVVKVTFIASALKSRPREYIPPIFIFIFAFNNKSLVAKNCSKVLFDAFHILLIIYFASHFQQFVYSLWLNIFNIKNIQCNEQRLPHLLYFILIKHILILALVVDKQIDQLLKLRM